MSETNLIIQGTNLNLSSGSTDSTKNKKTAHRQISNFKNHLNMPIQCKEVQEGFEPHPP